MLHPSKCLVPSCHKVDSYVDYLRDPEAAKQVYEKKFSHNGGGSAFEPESEREDMQVIAVRDVVLAAEDQLKAILNDVPRS